MKLHFLMGKVAYFNKIYSLIFTVLCFLGIVLFPRKGSSRYSQLIVTFIFFLNDDCVIAAKGSSLLNILRACKIISFF